MSVAELSQPMVSAPADEEEATAEKTMTIMEHLQELRMRLAVGAGAIVLGMIPGWFLFDSVFSILREPIQKLGPLHYFGPLDAFTLQLKISAVTGTMLAMPVLLYQMWAFIAPGLTKKERKHSIPFVLLGLVLFMGGVYTGYRILPLAMGFLLGFTSDNLQPVLDANKYLSFVGVIVLIFGISFELPLVLVFLCQLDIISSSWLVQKLRYAVFIIFIASMIITPGADPVSPVVLGTIMTGLYLFAIVLAKVIGK
ncbi:MAG TPA: twin-arginine translocase subunit TatC [Chloroflexota bacterium]|jgi:sec-independent protein translocase protein TatC|nr:twin-arginine translocase subunit TatC [Chloroflexota bacterium]